MRSMSSLFTVVGLMMFVTGCPGPTVPGGDANDNEPDGMVNDNTDQDDNVNANDGDGGGANDNDGGGSTTTTLDTLTFGDGNVPTGAGPITFDIGGGSVTFENGDSGTRGIPPLYGDDAFAWNIDPDDSPSTITFNDLNVVSINLYFAQSGATGGTLTALDADGNAIGDPISSVAAITLGDPNAFLDLVAPDGVAIASLTIAFHDGAGGGDVLAVDSISLPVTE